MARFLRRDMRRPFGRYQTSSSRVLGVAAVALFGVLAVLASAQAARATSPVPNDDFDDAQVMTLGLSTLGTTVGAGVEPGETTACGSGASIWYTATFSGNGTVRADTFGSAFDTRLGVFTGSAVNGLSAVACNDDAASGTFQSSVTFNAVAGTRYSFRVSGFNGSAVGAVQFSLDFGADLPAFPPTTTINPNTPIMPTPCSPSSASLGQWYRVVSPTGGLVTLNTATTTFDTVLTVLRLDPSGFVIQACNDDVSPGVLTSQVSFTALPGVRYYMVASGYNGAVGTLHLAVTNTAGNGSPAPAPLPVGPDAPPAPTAVAIEGGATVSWPASPPAYRPITGYRVTPVAAGIDQDPITFTSTARTQTILELTPGTSYTFRVAAINAIGPGADSPESNAVVIVANTLEPPTNVNVTGTATTATLTWDAPTTGSSPVTGYVLTPVVAGVTQAPVAVSADPTSHTFTGLTAGSTYTFRVAAQYATTTGPFATSNSYTAFTTRPERQLRLRAVDDPRAVGPGHDRGHGHRARRVRVLRPRGGGSIWYRASFTGNGTVRADTFGSDFDTVVGVFTGSAVDGLTVLACNDDVPPSLQSNVGFPAVAGTTYYFRVGGYNGATGVVQFTLDFGADLPVGSSTFVANTVANVPIMTTPCPYSSASLGQWYRLIPATGSQVTLSTAGSAFDTTLSVVRLSPSGFVVQACNDDDAIGGGLTSLVQLQPPRGEPLLHRRGRLQRRGRLPPPRDHRTPAAVATPRAPCRRGPAREPRSDRPRADHRPGRDGRQPVHVRHAGGDVRRPRRRHADLRGDAGR